MLPSPLSPKGPGTKPTKSPTRTPTPEARQPGNNLRNSANFLLGIREEPGKAVAFAQAAREGHHESLKFVAANVNPNLAYGSLLNAGKALMGGHLAMKQNCVYCSTAADQNLEALASGNATSFWIAEKTSAGNLPQEGSADRVVKKDDKVSGMLMSDIARGTRAIISVPQKDAPSYSHAMNFVHADDGSMHVIDGQNRKVYDLALDGDRKTFDDKFGHNGSLCIARFFTTGAAPRATTTAGTDADDWTLVR